LKKLLFISLAVVLALSMALVGCGGGGTVTYDLTIASTTGGSTTPSAGTHSYDDGEEVDLTATPASGYEFVNWSGDTDTVADVNDATTTITMDADYSVTANFEAAPWTSTITLSLHVTMPPNASLWEYVFQPFVWAVQNATGPDGGKIVFDVTFGAEPWDEPVALQAVGDDVTDLGQINGEQFHLGSIGYIPFLWNMEECAYATTVMFGSDEVATYDVLGELDDVKVLMGTPLQPAQWWGNVDVQSLADMSGLLVRAEDPEVPTIEALGAQAETGIEASEMAQALQLGTIDGCFFTYSGGAFAFGLKDVVSYITQVNLFPRIYVLGMNKAKYDSLPADAKAIIDQYSTPAYAVELAAAHDAAQGGAKGFIQNVPPKIAITVLSQAELDNWKAQTADVAGEWIDTMDGLGFAGQAVYDRALALIAQTPS
jgi:TRAP-type mannitol/chloroaromatic compound transport system substrate-binding protein